MQENQWLNFAQIRIVLPKSQNKRVIFQSCSTIGKKNGNEYVSYLKEILNLEKDIDLFLTKEIQPTFSIPVGSSKPGLLPNIPLSPYFNHFTYLKEAKDVQFAAEFDNTLVLKDSSSIQPSISFQLPLFNDLGNFIFFYHYSCPFIFNPNSLLFEMSEVLSLLPNQVQFINSIGIYRW